MGDEFEDTRVDTGSDMSDSGESFDDSAMDAGDEPVEDSGSEGLDSGVDSDESFDDTEAESADDSVEGLPDNEETSSDIEEPIANNDAPTDDSDAPTEKEDAATDDAAEDLPDGDAEGTDEPSDQSAETAAENVEDTHESEEPSDNAEKPVDKNAEATDDSVDDLPEGDEPTEDVDEPVDENAEAPDDSANDLPDGNELSEGTDEPAEENAEVPDDSTYASPDGDVEGTDRTANEKGKATDDCGVKGTDKSINEGRESMGNRTSNHINNESDAGNALSDAERAKNDLDYANEQYDIYKENVANGIQEPNAEIERGLQDVVNYAKEHYDDVTNGIPYSYNKPSDFWQSDEGRATSGVIGNTMSKILSLIGIGKDPTGNVDNAISSFAQEAMPYIADGSQKLMENTYNQYETPCDKYMRDHFMRDANGTPLSAVEGKAVALGESFNNASLDTEDFNDLKKEYFDDLKLRSECPDTIDDSIKDNEWKKINPELNGEMRDEFGNSKNKLISDWENQNNTKWPTYNEDVYSPNGKLIRHEGDKYDAHHIQPLTYGGENRAENITPLHALEHFDKQGVHSPDSPFGRMKK